ncbi:MAG: type II toxin-antitoxin system RelE/ParE family toxin [bacterium]|nr:type II toxin-antitoxin system RelE/ParE family toxin [bacterium]
MDDWKFEITDQGKADLKNLDAEVRKRVLEKLEWFAENFRNLAPIPLGGTWRGFFKLRVGDWRIVYEINYLGHLITIHVIDNRDRVYKKRR